ncbi:MULTISPECIES: cutinase family protein [unclassified Rhodococcus (in: high G+C Gram-positive bacteria)]|uniref:cutinase family protein n=1 Tax=unclassified Rhodococcus (in: high G+C Gram-positive bacteria) TaxID=192944 RepID=UPI0011799688|nr:MULTISPECIES: cutinase family protein [unclassified Rhodococcus (in: high G+C Gram-positive bacteria)]MBQ9055261.1 cutinase family protein [Rhodococcus sp. (in: high G+C Gram-positive bacteria)]
MRRRYRRRRLLLGSGSSGQLGEGSTQDRLTPVQVGAPPSNGCAGTTYFLGVRGSGEDPQPGSGDGDANGSHPSGMVQQLADEFGLFFYGADRPNRGIGTPVGAVSGYVGKSSRDTFVPLGIAYPAVEVEIGALDYPINYRSSVDLGAAGVHTVLSRLKSYCGAELPKVILSGYSQGAHVIEDALAWINDNDPALAALVTKTVLIASPVHRASGPENIGGANTAGALVHTRKPGTDAFVNAHPGVVTSICRPGDLVCDASFADGLSDPTTFIGINPQNGLGARIHTSYELSDIACPYTSLQQFTTICAANSALQALGRPLNTHTVSTQPGTSTDLDRQYSTRPGQKIDIVYTAKSGVSTGVSKIVNVFMYSAPTDLGSFEIGDDGFAAGTITIPASTPPGQHTLVLRRGDGETFTRAIVVDAAAGEPASALLLTVDGDSPDSEPYPVDPETPEPPIPGSGSLGSGSLGGS